MARAFGAASHECHAKVEITLGIYGHLLPGGDQTAAGTVADRILGAHAGPDEQTDPERDRRPDEESAADA